MSLSNRSTVSFLMSCGTSSGCEKEKYFTMNVNCCFDTRQIYQRLLHLFSHNKRIFCNSSIYRVPKCQKKIAADLSCLISAQKMYESQQINFAIKVNKTVNPLL